jgi:hypothetical protein
VPHDGFTDHFTSAHRDDDTSDTLLRGRSFMTDIDNFAPELFGFWPQSRVYDGDPSTPMDEAEAREAIGEYFLETKSDAATPGDDLRVLLNEMTAEMREQFAAFRELRKAAEQAASGNGDEAAAKLARADLKAATDAMSLIVRTLEKIDQLQRQFARDREQAAEDREAALGLDEAKARFHVLIEQRATERARQMLAEWQQHGAPDAADGGAESGASDGVGDGASEAMQYAEPG